MPFVSTNFDYRWLPDGINMELLNDLTYKISDKKLIKNCITGELIKIPKGEITDGSSIPRIFWPIAKSPFVGKHKFGAVLHDYLYRLGRWTDESICDRKTADKLFYEAMRECGVGFMEAQTKYWAVRMFGPRW